MQVGCGAGDSNILKYCVAMHSQYRRVHLCTVLRIKPGLFTQLNFAQHRNVVGQVRSSERGFKTRTRISAHAPCFAATALAGSLDWIGQPVALDKYRFVVPASAQTSSSLAHRQTELLCTDWLLSTASLLKKFDVVFGFSADRSLVSAWLTLCAKFCF